MKNAKAWFQGHAVLVIDSATHAPLFHQSLEVENAVSKACSKAVKFGYNIKNVQNGRFTL